MNFGNKSKNNSYQVNSAQQMDCLPLFSSGNILNLSTSGKESFLENKDIFVNSQHIEEENSNDAFLNQGTIETLKNNEWISNFNDLLFGLTDIPDTLENLNKEVSSQKNIKIQPISTSAKSQKQRKKDKARKKPNSEKIISEQKQIYEESEQDQNSYSVEENFGQDSISKPILKERVRGENGVMRNRSFEALYTLVHFQGQLGTKNIVSEIYKNFYLDSKIEEKKIKQKIKKRNYDVLMVLNILQLAHMQKKKKKLMFSSTAKGQEALCSTKRYCEIVKQKVEEKEAQLKSKKELLEKLRKEKQESSLGKVSPPGLMNNKKNESIEKKVESQKLQNYPQTSKGIKALDKIASINQSTMHEQLGSGLIKMFDDLSIQMDKPQMEDQEDFIFNDSSEINLNH